ncbi:Imm49 family immunity protein [Archangium violaceum]|uniref:Imm49 family immunity protein n=1 Tax=Archangium violaceum TaxID=83451 RepID=UPI002B2F3E1E|nr:Imm49 family immunity protein [Archangium gephyra]
MLEPESLEVLTDDIGFCTRNLKHPKCTLRHAGRFYEELCQKQRARGISRLLLNADSDGFCHDLIESGRTWRHFFARCAKDGYSDFYMACSRSEPFFDALAAGSFELARALAALSPKSVRTGDEYEDDYCYARFFHCLVLEENAVVIEAVLEQFEAALDGGTNARLEICRALWTRKTPDVFEEAFLALLEERKEEVRKEQGPRTLAVETNQNVFVEGLGVLRLAERAGLSTRREYELCPALARLPMEKPPPASTFGDDT